MKAIALVLLLVASRAEAQPHPCDQATPSSVTVQAGATHFVRWCSPLTDRIEALVLFVDGVPTSLLAVAQVSGANSAGLAFYQSAYALTLPVGTHVVEAGVYNLDQATGVLQRGPLASLTVYALSGAGATPPPIAPAIKDVLR